MATLEKVMQMKNEGLTEGQIIGLLRKEGVSPKEINDALSQSKIKSTINSNVNAPSDDFADMKPSIMLDKRKQQSEPPPEEQYEEYSEEAPIENNPEQNYNQEYYYPEYQPPKESYGTDIETINDITEQIVEEKNIELKKQISDIIKFKDETRIEIEKIKERVDKIENVFNELQVAILRKIGEYGEDIKNVSDTINATQESFSKLVNPLTDNIRELQKITKLDTYKDTIKESDENKKEEERKKSGKSKPNFEEYLR